MSFGNKYKHGKGDLPASCGIDLEKLKAKQKQINKFINVRNENKDNKFYRSQVVEKMESLFTKRELAFLVQQYSEVIQSKIVKPRDTEFIDPSITFIKK